jgi:hypothetical protein
MLPNETRTSYPSAAELIEALVRERGREQLGLDWLA